MSDDDAKREDKIFHLEDGIPVFNARLGEVERKQTEAESREKEQISINRWMMRFTGALVLFAAVTGIVNGIQAHIASKNASAARDNADAAKGMVNEMKKSGTDTKALAEAAGKQATNTEKLVIAAGKQADAAKVQADNAVKALKNTQAAFQDDQRAWVGLSANRVVQFEQGKSVKFEIDLFNSGKSPAVNGSRWGMYDFSTIADVGPTPIDLAQKRVYFRVGAIPPQGRQTLHVEVPWDSFKPFYAAVMAKTRTISLFGEFLYEDSAHRPHVTKYCLYLADPSRTDPSFCTAYNDMN